MALARWLSYLFHGPAWITFLAMGMATGGVAVCTVDLFELFRSHFDLWASRGAMAIFEVSPLQLAELALWGYLGVACYLVFKGCMDGLLARVPPRRRPVEEKSL